MNAFHRYFLPVLAAVALAAVALLLTAENVRAEEPSKDLPGVGSCAHLKELVPQFKGLGFVPVGIGEEADWFAVQEDGAQPERASVLWFRPADSAWGVTSNNAEGFACLTMRGTNWSFLAPKKPDTEA